MTRIPLKLSATAVVLATFILVETVDAADHYAGVTGTAVDHGTCSIVVEDIFPPTNLYDYQIDVLQGWTAEMTAQAIFDTLTGPNGLPPGDFDVSMPLPNWVRVSGSITSFDASSEIEGQVVEEVYPGIGVPNLGLPAAIVVAVVLAGGGVFYLRRRARAVA